mgnify:CR=1 FL=1
MGTRTRACATPVVCDWLLTACSLEWRSIWYFGDYRPQNAEGATEGPGGWGEALDAGGGCGEVEGKYREGIRAADQGSSRGWLRLGSKVSMTVCIRWGFAALGLWPLLAGRVSFPPGDADYLHCLVIALTLCRRGGWPGHNKSW